MKKPNETFNLSIWFWKEVWGREVGMDTLKTPDFRKLMGMASRLLSPKDEDGNKVNGLDPRLVKKTIEQMMAAGLKPKNLYAIEWTHRQSGLSWYGYISQQDSVVPPIYDQLALRDYLLTHQPDSPLLAVL